MIARLFVTAVCLSVMLVPGLQSLPALARGQDSTRAERNAQIISRLLEGRHDNANQAYFDRRLSEPEENRHTRYHLTIDRVADETRHVFWHQMSAQSQSHDEGPLRWLTRLSPDADGWGVRLAFYTPATGDNEATRIEGCDLVWREEAGQFRAYGEGDACTADTPRSMMLSEDQLWFSLDGEKKRPYALERARVFQCYMDVPGVGGGRDIPYRRYQLGEVHDRGGKAEVTLDDGQQLYVRLQNVRWPINNLENIFTRHFMVLYVGETKDDESTEIAYTWTQPKAQRIGLNLKSLLVNCFMLNNEEIEPFYRDEPEL